MPNDQVADAQKKHVLLVEDDQFLCDMLVQKLESAGLTITVASDAEKAFVEAKAHVPDLILLDLILPGMSGFELIDKLRKEQPPVNAPFIVLSNSAEAANKQEAETMGAKAYLVKSQTTPAEIAQTIAAQFAAQ